MSDSKELNKRDVNWLCVVFNLQIFISWLFGLHFVIYDSPLTTTIFAIFLILLGLTGITAGAHRLWAHNSYKATATLRIFLMLCHTITGHSTIYYWVQLHRLHHKYFKTDLDPFNPSKGFFYSHFIANNLNLSQAQENALKEINMADLEQDKVVMFQKKFYWILFPVVTLLLPLNAPMEYWGDSVWSSVFVVGLLRYGTSYHLSLLIHSATNIFDLNENAKNYYDSNAVYFISKSYWLSYHYMVPWDYQSGEYGKYGKDCTSKFIRVCAALELAFDLKFLGVKEMRDALATSVIQDKNIINYLQELKVKNEANHFLTPNKFY